MKLNEYKKLEEVIKDQDFHKNYKNIDKVMFCLSIFGHISSIFLAYFLVSKILSGAITDNIILVGISSIILLTGLELLKREMFNKFSLQQIRLKNVFHKDVVPLLIFSSIIVSISFYSSIKGAQEFSLKSKQIDDQTEMSIKNYEDSLKSISDVKIKNIESQILKFNIKYDEKDKEQTQIESNNPLTQKDRNRIRDLKNEKSSLKQEISQNKEDVEKNKDELKNSLKEYEDKVTLKSSEKKDENKTNSLFFVIISTLIELTILAGVYFNKYYQFRSYSDFKTKIDKDPNFQKWESFDKILNIIYTQDTKINDKITSNKNITDICKVNGISIIEKDISSFMKLLNSLNITKTSGSSRYFMKSKETSHDILRTHFNIE